MTNAGAMWMASDPNRPSRFDPGPPLHGRIDMNIRDIVTDWLQAHGYDGLCYPEMECGCILSDLMPCDEPSHNHCEAGHRELQDDGDWLMFPGKEEVPNA